jgi:sec-independent protein translocase protein TatC
MMRTGTTPGMILPRGVGRYCLIARFPDPTMTRLPDSPSALSAANMTFGEHLEDLRRRVILALLGIVPIFIACVAGGDWLMAALLGPAQRQLRAAGLPATLQSTGPLESFGAYMKVSVAVTIMLGLPWIIYQLWLFVSPGLHEHEKRFARLLLPMSGVLTALGLLFLYFVMLPAMLLFLINFGASLGRPVVATGPAAPGVTFPQIPAMDHDPVTPPAGVLWFNTELDELRYSVGRKDGSVQVVGTPMGVTAGIAQQYRVGEYAGLVFFLALAFAIGFQTPVVVLLLGWLGIVERSFLTRNRKYVVFISAVAAAVLTPTPDPLSMMLLAVPLYLLFELGLVMLRFLPPSRVARGFTWGGKRYGVEPADAGDA